jgi:hypothetical protein
MVLQQGRTRFAPRVERNQMVDIADVSLMTSRIKELEEAAAALVSKLHEIMDHPSYGNLFILAKIHGQEYDGPNFGDEFDHLVEVLSKGKYDEST